MDKGNFPAGADAEADEKEADSNKEDPTTTTSNKTPSPRTPRGPSPKIRNIPQAARLPVFLNNWTEHTRHRK